jgi:hypothetical protein
MIAAAIMGLFIVAGCDPGPSSQLKGQTNTTLTFYGLVVDENGSPLSGATIAYQVDAYPEDWTFDTRGRPYDMAEVSATSDERGRFQFTATGCILRRLDAERLGYRHFFDEDVMTSSSNSAYRLIAWGDLNYKTDADHPAIYVFVKDGINEVSALPSRGGYSFDGKQWTPNQPGWPKKPSLPDVVYKAPATRPASGS